MFSSSAGSFAGGSAAEVLEGFDVKHLALIPGYLYNGGQHARNVTIVWIITFDLSVVLYCRGTWWERTGARIRGS